MPTPRFAQWPYNEPKIGDTHYALSGRIEVIGIDERAGLIQVRFTSYATGSTRIGSYCIREEGEADVG